MLIANAESFRTNAALPTRVMIVSLGTKPAALQNVKSEKVCSPEFSGQLLQEAEWLQLSGWCSLDIEADLLVASTSVSCSCAHSLDCLLSTSQLLLCAGGPLRFPTLQTVSANSSLQKI